MSWPIIFTPFIFCLTYFISSDFRAWDMEGHLIASKKFSESIFPFLSGWNKGHFAGYPEGFLYPSPFH